MKKIVLAIIITLLLLILGINICSMKEISLLGYRTFIISSGSMTPYLEVNDIVLIKSKKNYKEKDVITYKHDDEYITHRIIKINGEEITTQGDANNIEDMPINKKQVIGKVIFKMHVSGFIAYLFKRPFFWGLIFITGLVVTILIPNNK